MSDQANPDPAVEVAKLRARLAEAETTLEATRLGARNAPAGAGRRRDQTPTLTPQQQAEEAVNRSQQTLAELVERAPFGIYVVDSRFRIAHMNANSQTGAFRNVRPVMGRDFGEAMRILWPEPVAAEILSHFRHTLETGEPYYSPRFSNPRHDLQTVESYEWELHRLTLPDGQHGVICYYYDSTKLHEAEAALQASEQRFRRLYDSGLLGVIFWNMDGVITDANDRFLEMVGYSREDLNAGGIDWVTMTPPEHRHLDEASVKELKATGVNKAPFEKEYLRKDGSRLPVIVAGAMLDETRSNGVAFVLDISERKHAEQALASQREELQLILDSAPALIFYKDRENRFLRVNRAFADSMGQPKEQLEGRSLFDLYPREQAEAYWQDDKEVLVSGQPKTDIVEPMRTPAGERWVQTGKVPCRDARGNFTGVIGFALDITRRKQAEEALRESEARAKVAEAVHTERQRLAEVLNMLPAYVILLTPDYRVPFANRFFEERFGQSEGRRCYEYLFDRTAPCEVCETFKVLKTNAPLRWAWTGPDGRSYDIHDFPFTDVDGSPLIMEVGLDITERKQAEAELVKHREHLQELVSERTFELRATNKELARFNQAMVGRELRMIELKQEVNKLCAQLDQPPRYPLQAEPEDPGTPKTS